MNVLVDTSVWSLALRRSAQNLNSSEKAVVTELTELINEGRVKMIGLIRQELLSGIKHSAQFVKLRDILRAFPDEHLESDDFESAAAASNQCRSKGIAVSVSDMLICSVAQSRDWAVFSLAPDFRRYSKILPISLHTVQG
jgi:hypothetical protein